MKKKTKIDNLEKLAYECAIRNIDLEKVMNFITSNETLRYLSTLKAKNLNYLKKVFNSESKGEKR